MRPPIGAAVPAAVSRPARRRRLGEVLVEQGAITEEQLQQALAVQANVAPDAGRKRLGTVVVECNFATERQVASALATAMDMPLVDLRDIQLSPQTIRLLPQAVAMRQCVLVVGRQDSGALTIATADPTNIVAIDDVKIYTGVPEINIVVAPESQIRDYLTRAWSITEGGSEMSEFFSELKPEVTAIPEGDASGVDDAPLVKLVNAVFADAVRARASDVHVQPEADDVRIRYRVDGVLREIMTVPKAAAPGLVSRVKVVAGLDIAERRIPQDGRTNIVVDGTKIDARVSTLPAVHGEKVVVRLLSKADSVPDISRMGLDAGQLEGLLTALDQPQGLILITGPTGSGKTNTLYSAINRIRRPEVNIVTLEDPVEIQVPGITQVQANEKAGLTFARGLRSILRQDPDVVLVGEVRDAETAKLALEASMTGHLVLTTLHTNNAPAALTRLVDMGVEPFLVASSLNLVVGQRLVRRPCDSCAAPYRPDPRSLLLLGLTDSDIAHGEPRKGQGCGDCGHSGYRGRLGVFEVLVVTPAIRSVLMSNPTEAAVAAAARTAGMVTLRGSGLAKAMRGETTFEEVLRVTTGESGDDLRCTGCRAGLSADMLVCPWCETAVGRTHCESCNRALDQDWRVCPWCRRPASAASGSGLLPIQAAQRVGQPGPRSAP
jgi:type IV pilus assembly protein PilB